MLAFTAGCSVQVDSEACCTINMALDACLAALRVLTAPGLERQVITEDMMELILGFLRSHLLLDLLVFYDSRLRQLHRPALNERCIPPWLLHVACVLSKEVILVLALCICQVSTS